MVIVVTGAGGGIGRAVVRELAHDGHRVVALGHGRIPEFSGVSVIAGTIDVTSGDDEVASVVHQVANRVGPIDVWMNNAGADILTPPLCQAPYWAKWQALAEVDIAGTMRCCRVVPPFMAPLGQIINVAWDHYQVGWAGEEGELYAAAKAAIVGYSRSLARSFQARAIPLRVNILAPGWVRTRWGESLDGPSAQKIAVGTFSGQWMTPEHVAAMVRAMIALSPEATNGHIFWVNGGDVMG